MTTKKKKKVMKPEGNTKRSLAMKAHWVAIKAREKESEAKANFRLSLPEGFTVDESKLSVIPETKKPSHPGVLTCEEINAIISTCHANNVLSFQFAGLRLLFKKSIDEPIVLETKRSSAGDELLSLKGASKVERHEKLQELSDVATDELEYMKINDPLGYEQFIQSEDVEDDGNQ